MAGGRMLETAGGFLFTHRGYSGPAVLDISHVAVRARAARAMDHPVFVQWTPLPEETWHELLKPAAGKQGDTLVRTRVRQHLPDRLADWLMRDAGVTPDQAVATLTRDVRRRLVERLIGICAALDVRRGLSQGGSHRRRRGAGRGAAEDVREPASPGLFLCGEMLDAFGPIGGHNFCGPGRPGGSRAAARRPDCGDASSITDTR